MASTDSPQLPLLPLSAAAPNTTPIDQKPKPTLPNGSLPIDGRAPAPTPQLPPIGLPATSPSTGSPPTSNGAVPQMPPGASPVPQGGSPPASVSPQNGGAAPASAQNRRSAVPPVSVPNGQNFVDITEYLNMPQSEAAKKLNIPPSTLSKRWKEAVRNRKWPWRVVCKLDKEIMTLLHNVPQGAPIPDQIEGRLGYLMRKRQEELKPVVIRL